VKPRQTLTLPGERVSNLSLRPSRTILASLAALGWLLVQATVLPLVGLSALPFDPVLPLIVAFALGEGVLDAWMLAIVLGYSADFFAGTGSGRLLMQYALIVGLASPFRGRIVLGDRWVPAFGTAVLALGSGLIVLLFLSAQGATTPDDFRQLPRETAGTLVAAVLFWPLYRSLAGWSDERSRRFGRER